MVIDLSIYQLLLLRIMWFLFHPNLIVMSVVLTYSILIMQFSRDKRSSLAVGDISEIIPDKVADIAVLEEPEHLTWYHHGKRWKTKFRLVIGIIHTNYLEYVKREKNGVMQAFLLKYLNNWVVGIYCHKASYYIIMENSIYVINIQINITLFHLI